MRTLFWGAFALFLSLTWTACTPPTTPVDSAASALQQTDQTTLQHFDQLVTNIQTKQQEASPKQGLTTLVAPAEMQKKLVTNPNTPKDSTQTATTALSDSTPMLVENGAMLIAVRQYEDARQKVLGLVQQHNALIVSEHEYHGEQRIENTFVIRVPALHFHPLLNQFRELAMVLREKRIWQEDKTAQLLEAASRIESKKTAQVRFQEQIRANKSLNDQLAVQREINTIQEELDVLQQTSNNLQHQIQQSTITLTLYQDISKVAPVQAGFGERISSNFQNGWSNFTNFLIVAATYWVYIALGMVFLFVIWLAARNSRKQAQAYQQQLWNTQQQWLNQVRKPSN